MPSLRYSVGYISRLPVIVAECALRKSGWGFEYVSLLYGEANSCASEYWRSHAERYEVPWAFTLFRWSVAKRLRLPA